MSLQEFRIVAMVVGAIAAAGTALAVAGSALFGGITPSSLTLWLVLIGVPMTFVAGSTSGTIPFGTNRLGGSAWNESMANETLAPRLDDNRAENLRRHVQLSWTTAIALAGVVLVIAGGVVTFAA